MKTSSGVNKIQEAKNIISSVSEKTDRVVLFFSCGKDSLALLDLLSPFFKEIICVHMYFVHGLEHIEKYLRWAETKYPNVKIEQAPHWNLTYILRSGMFCVRNSKVKLLKLSDIDNAIRLKYNVIHSFYGMKKADGMNRRLMLNTYKNGENNGKVYPLADWTQNDIMSYLKLRKLPEPVRYSKNASGGCGFNLDCFLWMRDNYPKDLQKVLKTFPMSEKLLLDYHYIKQNKP